MKQPNAAKEKVTTNETTAAPTAPASAAAPAAKKKLTVEEKLEKLRADAADKALKLAQMERQLDDRRETASETASLDGRLAKLTHHQPEGEEGFQIMEDFDLDSEIGINDDDDEDSLRKKFADLDLKYTQLAVAKWHLRMAYNQKHREVSKQKHARAHHCNIYYNIYAQYSLCILCVYSLYICRRKHSRMKPLELWGI